jgi:hypothetical protein
LVGKISINSYEGVEFFISQTEKFAVLYASPASLRDSRDIVTNNFSR